MTTLKERKVKRGFPSSLPKQNASGPETGPERVRLCLPDMLAQMFVQFLGKSHCRQCAVRGTRKWPLFFFKFFRSLEKIIWNSHFPVMFPAPIRARSKIQNSLNGIVSIVDPLPHPSCPSLWIVQNSGWLGYPSPHPTPVKGVFHVDQSGESFAPDPFAISRKEFRSSAWNRLLKGHWMQLLRWALTIFKIYWPPS